MTLLVMFWNSWSQLFRAIPNGDPYVAAFVLVVLLVMVIKTLRSASKYIVY
jgi:hypothetical protein